MKLLGFEIYRGNGHVRVEKATLAEIIAARSTGLERLGVGQGWAPASYSEYMALSVPVYRAVTLRANAVATAPLRVARRLTKDESEQIGSEHPAQALIDKVNQFWTQVDLIVATETYLSLLGVAYWWVEKQGSTPVGIWPLNPSQVRVVPARPGGKAGQYISGFVFQPNAMGKPVPLLPEEVVWFRRFNPIDEYAGLSPIAPARQTLDMGRNALRYNAKYFDNSAIPADLLFTSPGSITVEQAEEFYRVLEARHKGAGKAHRPMLAGDDMKATKLGLSNRDMEFLASLNYTVEDAARIWGVPPPKMYTQTTATYNNVKQADIEFYTDTISAEWRFMEAEINEMLMPMFGDPTLYVAFDTSKVLPLQEALGELHNRQRADVLAGILTVNEVRGMRRLEPVAWGDEPVSLLTGLTAPQGGEMNGKPPSVLPTPGKALAKAYSAVQQDAIVKAYEARLTRREREFLITQRDLFDAQRRDVLQRLHGEKSLERQWEQALDIEEWIKRFQVKGKPLMLKLLVSAAIDQTQDFGLGPFDRSLSRVDDWVKARADWWATEVNQTTANLLLSELQEGSQLGEGVSQLAERVEKVFAFNNSVRAERIARTESIAASSAGTLEMYHQAGVTYKQWLTQIDERTRDSHIDVHGQIRLVGEPFSVGGEQLEAPGIGGSAKETVNCRCAVVPVANQRSYAIRPSNGHVEVK